MPLILLTIARSVQIGASLLLMGIFTFELLVLRSGAEPECGDARVMGRLLRLAWWSAIAGLLSALLWFAFEVTSMTRLPLATAFSTADWRTVLFQTRFGHVWQLRLSLILLSLFLIGLRRLAGQWRKALTVFLWLLVGTLLISLAWISHPAAVREQPLGVLGDALHLAAAGLWLGGLPCLAIYLVTVPVARPQVVQRFSSLSLGCVAVLVVSGLCNTWLLVGSVTALFETRYGTLLLCKLALFALLLALGARNRIFARRFTSNTGRQLVDRLNRRVACEIALGCGVVAIVGGLGVTPPPRDKPVPAAMVSSVIDRTSTSTPSLTAQGAGESERPCLTNLGL